MDQRYSTVLEGDATLEDLKRAKEEFWGKLKSAMGKVPFARDAVALYYLIKDGKVPFSLRGTAVLALLYFISPLDFVPDTIPIIGFVDDAMVVATAMSVLADVLTPFRGKADVWLKKGAKPEPDEPEEIKPVQVQQHQAP